MCARISGSYSALKVYILDVVTWKKPGKGLFDCYSIRNNVFGEAGFEPRRHEDTEKIKNSVTRVSVVKIESFQPAQIFHEQAHTESAGAFGAVGHFMVPI